MSEYYEERLKDLLQTDPELLISLVTTNLLRNDELTFAAEILGELPDKARALALLTPLAAHPSALVREGVIYGLQNLDTPEAKTLLRQINKTDIALFLRPLAHVDDE